MLTGISGSKHSRRTSITSSGLTVASEMAVALGIKDVVNFRGGTKAWKDAGLPVEVP